MRKVNGKTIIISVIAAVLCVSVILTIGILSMNRETTYAVIDGEKVLSEEMTLYLTGQRAATAQYFMQEYGLSEIGTDFWTTKYGDTTPVQYLIDKSIEKLRYDKAIFSDCEKIDGVGEISFEVIKKDMESENERRKSAQQGGQTVYGVTEYTIFTYLDYVKSNLIIKEKEALSENGMFSPDEVALKTYYNEIRDNYPLFKNEDGSYKSYGDVRAKVQYLYEENEYDTYIKDLVDKQKVKCDNEAITELALSIDE